MIVAVLDTNVLASGVAGIARPESIPGELLRRWRDNAYKLVLSEPILEELDRTLTNPYFRGRLSLVESTQALAQLHAPPLIQPITVQVVGVAAHPEDDAILATAISAGAGYLVTGDKPFLELVAYRGVRLLSPRQFLHILNVQQIE